MAWRPSNEPTGIDQARVARLEPIEVETEALGLPVLRYRKLSGILNALTIQIEDGGDSPEVNKLLLDALRAGFRHQVGERKARAALRAIDVFEQAEEERWEQVKAGTLPPIELTPDEQLDDLMQEGYSLLEVDQRAMACDQWLEAWELIKQMATPEMRTVDDLDHAYPGMMQSVFNWCSDLEMELHNAGLTDPIYHEHRLRYAREFLAQFPEVNANFYVNFMRAQGEALWNLGRRADAEAVFAELVQRFPDEGWGYIGWSDHYYLYRDPLKEYDKAEAILQQALARPSLRDRTDVLDRLAELYAEWGKPDKQAAVEAELESARAKSGWSLRSIFKPPSPSTPPPEPTPTAKKRGVAGPKAKQRKRSKRRKKRKKRRKR